MAEVYSPLPNNHIRLMTILRGKRADPIECTLKKVPLDDNTDFEALSYVWGSPKVTSDILVNKQGFQITTNLKAALLDLRYSDKERRIWIDAVCINQSDIDEKNVQVQYMGEIYRTADCVTVWLAPHSEELSKGIDQILELGNASHLSSIQKYRICAHNKYMDHRDEDPDVMFDSLRKVFEAAWFSRLWITQEIALARHAWLYCGHRRFSWEDLTKLSEWFQVHRNCCYYYPKRVIFDLGFMSFKTRTLIRIRNYVTTRGPFDSLSTVSEIMRNMECTDDRDRVYGYLGLVNNESIRIDYNLSVAEVYKQATLAVIGETGSLDVISKATRRQKHHDLTPRYRLRVRTTCGSRRVILVWYSQPK